MYIPEPDKRTESDIIKRITELARSYTPEWKPDISSPDVGLGLAEIFAEMHAGTIRRFNRFAEKNRIAFCNFMGAQLRPSEIASGYVSFGLSSEQLEDGVFLPSGTVLSAGLPDGKAGFTTTEDVFVSNASLSAMYLTDGVHDRIQEVYGGEEKADFVLFGANTANRSFHVAYVGCRNGFLALTGEEHIRLKLTEKLSAELETAWKNRVLRISYSTEEGWEDFRFCTSREDELWLVKELEQPKAVECDVNGERAFWIKFSLLDIHAVTDTETHGVGIAVSGTSSAPDAVVTKMGTVDENAFYAFGETPALFDSVYFGSDEALSKAGGEISVQFNVSFSPLPDIKAVEKPADGNWKTVMRKSDMHIEEPDIVSIKSVVWEYYNGTGWKPLNCSPEMKNAFCPVEGTKTYNLTFRCPDDIRPYIAEADERRFIRARIVRMEQSFRWNAIYRAPLLSYIRFQYRCDRFIPVDIAIAENRMKSEIHGGEETFLMFEPMKLDIPAWYLGFTRPLTGGPHRFLISLGQ